MPPMTSKPAGTPADVEPTRSFALPVVSSSEASTPVVPDLAEVLFTEASEAGSSASERGYGKQYWRSIEDKLATPAYLEEIRPEFPVGADLPPQGVERRQFMQLLGASMALAGATACTTRPSNEKLLPYSQTPANLKPGVPLHYASGMSFSGEVSGLLITAWEGRPTKIEGNPQHPVNQGAAGSFEQAFLLSLYDPNRAKELRQGRVPKALRTFAEEAASLTAKAGKADGGARVRFLLEPTSSPVKQSLRARIQQKLPNARFYSYATADEAGQREGTQALFGQALHPRYDFAKADVVLSLDSDFLESRPEHLAIARAFSNRRDPAMGKLNRLYQCETRFSVTGGMADHRLRLRSQEVASVAAAVLAQVGGPGAALASQAQSRFPLNPAHAAWVKAVAQDLLSARGRSVVVPGERQPAAVHALAHAINAALGNLGSTVQYLPALIENNGNAGLRTLVEEIRAGKVDTLVVTAFNPVYAAPVDVGLAEVLDARKNPLRKNLSVIYTSQFEDETSALTDWFIPAAHELEAWGDGRSADGTLTLVQPLIRPLFNGVPEAELLSLFADDRYRNTYELTREQWGSQGGPADFETSWESWVSLGFMPNTASAFAAVTPSYDAAATTFQSATVAPGELEINFVTDYKVFDGRYANNAWLQELPDPVSRLTWDNAAYVSPPTAKRLGLEAGSLAELKYQGRTLQVGVLVAPGHADDAVTLSLGYGRTGSQEKVAHGAGFNANALRTSKAPWFDGGATLSKVRGSYKFSLTQTHWSMEGRPLALDMTLEELHSDHATMERVQAPQPSLLKDYPYEGYKWAMAIDMSRCMGCQACVVACQAENNIPVVGKEQVGRGREMLWLRMDRYFTGADIANPGMVHQPVMCVHCEKAPCEYVCPVNATVHSDEGLNEMVYNRCVGTRYCSNNCPYKVRRFNYLHFSADKTSTQKMLMNPDVTVRARGVMEKCSYCVQRIERARIESRVEKKPISEKNLQTACQQTCATNAIVFGTLSDPHSQVSQKHNDARAYRLLNELGTQPRTKHMVRIRNPNPALVAEAPHAPHEGGH